MRRRIPVAKAKKLYLSGKTLEEVGRILGFSAAGIFKALNKIDFQFRSSGTKDRPWSIKKRGIEYRGADGRWYVRTRRGKRGKAIRRATLVMEQKLGSPIPKGYHIHHQDHNIENDDPKNLKLMSAKDHTRLHHLGIKNPAKGNANRGKGRVNPEVRTQMKKLRSKGWSQQKIADQLGFHQTAVSKVLAGRL